MDKQDFLRHIREEVELSREFVSEKRELFRNRLRQYIEPNKDEEKIDSNLIYSAINTSVAISYADKLNVAFEPRKFWEEEYADNLTEVANFDYDEMNMPIINFQKEWDRHFFGVGLRVKSGWDINRNCPIFTVKDPLSWLPDPRGNHIDPFRFHYFEEEMTKDSMTKDYGFDESAVEQAGIQVNRDTESSRQYKDDAQALNTEMEEDIDNPVTAVINWYTEYKGVKYAITVDDDIKNILRMVEIEPVLNEEKKDQSLIEYPVIVSYYSPLRWDPYGVSLCDLMEDKQKAVKILSNLRLISAKFATFGQQFLYDWRAIKNIQDLKKPSINPKYIAFDGKSWVPISNALYPVPRENIMADSFNVSNDIITQVYKDTGMDARTLWVQGEKNITLGESQQIQSNANVRLGLNMAINFWSEKKFWKLWLRCYNEYFSGADRKFVRITTWFESISTEFRKDDFMAIQDPNIIIDSESNISAKREKIRIAFQAQLPVLMADPSIPQISKTYALRYSLRLNGIPKDMIKVMTFNPTEVSARNKLILINNNNEEWAKIDSMDEDHLTYKLIFQSAIDNETKIKAIRKRDEAIIAINELTWNIWQNNDNNWAMQWIANASAAQLTNSAIQNNANWVVSTQAISNQ